MNNLLFEELLIETRRAELNLVDPHRLEIETMGKGHAPTLRGAIAEALVRLAMRLDAGAGYRAVALPR